ncbi:MAG: metallophosphoesterase [Parasporobacterium sp.]|nr:metallophosphoesterase [Parasporobacterium sp.]
MAFWLILLIILLVLIAGLIGRALYEVTHPEVRRYSFRTGKLSSNEKVRIVFLADLHSRKYGRDNAGLIRMVSRIRPDFIILGGDMITASRLFHRDNIALSAIEGLTNIAPVFYVPGNHERELSENERQTERYADYMFELECMDVTYLSDRREILTEDMFVHGLNIDSRFYKKFGKSPQMPPSYITGKLGKPEKGKYNILVAHSPEFFDTYTQMGYDLVLCGHYHGGMIDLPWFGPLISPNLTFRPEHSGGAYKKSDTYVVVSRGIGAHHINIRLFNRPEVVVIDIKQEDGMRR